MTAYAFVLGYLVYLTIVYVLARNIHGFRWQALSLGLLGLHTSLGVALLVLALIAPLCSGRGITTSCSGNGSVRPAGRANQNRRHVTYRCARRPHLRSHWLANNTHKNETR